MHSFPYIYPKTRHNVTKRGDTRFSAGFRVTKSVTRASQNGSKRHKIASTVNKTEEVLKSAELFVINPEAISPVRVTGCDTRAVEISC